MKLKSNFEVVHIADEHIIVPIGEQREQFKGVVVLNEAAAFLLEKMSEDSVLPVITLDYSESISDNNDESFTTEDGVSIINF